WLSDRENQRYRLFGRLASGATMSRVQAEMSPITEHLRTLHDPRSDWAKTATVLVWPGSPFPQPLRDYGGLRLCVLLIIAAGGLAFLFTWAMLKAATVAMATAFPGEYGAMVFDVTPDLEIFGFVSAISLAAGMLSGLAPAMQSSKAALHSAVGGGTAPVRSR